MKKNKALDLRSYSFVPGEKLLLDANVWLYLYPTPSSSQALFAVQYSNAFKRMLQAKTSLVLDALVLSEYVNRYCRVEWQALPVTGRPDYKSFRNSAFFAPVGQGAALHARKMLQLCSREDHPFSLVDMDRVLNELETGKSDLNDGLLVETCRIHGWKLVTNDKDMVHGGIVVLTTNKKLLSNCA